MKKLLLITVTIILILNCNAQVDSMYFGQTPPGDTAVIFAPGIISLPNRNEFSIVFSPDGNEAIYLADSLYYIKRENNTWSHAVQPPFSVNQIIITPIFSLDGKELFYTKYSSDYANHHIWKVGHNAGGWGEPQLLPAPINFSNDGGYAETADSVIYFHSNRSGSTAIWCKHSSSDQAEKLDPIVNSTSAYNPCIAPDGSYLIFTSVRTGKIGLGDIYVSFNKGNNEWTTPVNMNSGGAEINVPQYDQIYPSLSPDGKYLFFQRNKIGTQTDIYWVSTHILDTLKKIAIPTGLVQKTIEKNVKIYPNPTSGQFTISFGSNPVDEALVTISNLQGAQVFSKIFKNVASDTIDLTGNPAGIYMVKVIADGVSYEEKIVKE